MNEDIVRAIEDCLIDKGYKIKLVEIPGYIPDDREVNFVGEIHIRIKKKNDTKNKKVD